ncbi:YveK family protein [Neobacillus muris]|uniref:YveK family protein n=1 Tax=Neobacillus muris TaxID=2941334 RepID=UPI002040F03F|nr:Wzz/FepE/Etk N-terminal domain-containing protein [Neobacillus muris]
MGESTYIGDLFKILKRFIWLILLLGLIGGVAGKFLTGPAPAATYQTSALVLIKQQPNQTNTLINQADDTARFMNTAQTLVNTPVILNAVKKELGLKDNTKVIANKVKSGIENGSQILRITVEDSTPSAATNLVNNVAEVFQQEIGNYLDVTKVQIVEKAQKGQEAQILQTRSNANIIMGAIIGLIIGAVFSFVLSYTSKSKKS